MLIHWLNRGFTPLAISIIKTAWILLRGLCRVILFLMKYVTRKSPWFMLFTYLCLQDTRGGKNFIMKRNHNEYVQMITRITATALPVPSVLSLILGFYHLFESSCPFQNISHFNISVCLQLEEKNWTLYKTEILNYFCKLEVQRFHLNALFSFVYLMWNTLKPLQHKIVFFHRDIS